MGGPFDELFSYPLPENAAKRDCFWTALNFFLPVPDDDALDGPALRRMLDERYERVAGEPLLGDILVLFRPSGEAEHAAVYIAGDVYFTKNGSNIAIPWLLMGLSDILDRYEAARGAPLVHYRPKLSIESLRDVVSPFGESPDEVDVCGRPAERLQSGAR